MKKNTASHPHSPSTEDLQRFFRFSHDLFCTAGFDGLIKMMNPALEKLLRLPLEDATSRPFIEFVHPADRTRVSEQMKRNRSGRPTSGFQVRTLLPDGRHIWTSWDITPLPAAGLILCVGQNIDRLKESEMEQQRLTAIVNSSTNAIIGQDAEGFITSWNRGAELMYGYKTHDIIGRRAISLLMTDPHPMKHRVLTQVLAGQPVHNLETTHTRKDGKKIEVEMSIWPVMNNDGKQIGVATVARDISDKKIMEHRMIHMERLAAMGQMAAGLAHELKTPMTVILGYVELLLDMQKSARRDVKDYLKTIKTQTQRCGQLANNLLNFSKRERPAKTTFDINRSVTAAMDLVKPLALEKSLCVHVHLAQTALPVYGHKQSLQQVILNLAANAVDAAPESSDLTISTRQQDTDTAEVSVSDRGSGIADDVRPRLFEPFFTTKGRQGTGLGLWTVKEIVNELDGRISYISEPGKGTTFTVSIPIAKSIL